MSETPAKGIGTIKWSDLVKGVYYACIGQILYMIGFFFMSLLQEQPRLPTWIEWLPYLKAIAVSIGGYVIGKLGINNVGQPLAKDKPVVHVDVEDLNNLKEQAKTNN